MKSLNPQHFHTKFTGRNERRCAICIFSHRMNSSTTINAIIKQEREQRSKRRTRWEGNTERVKKVRNSRKITVAEQK